MSANTNMATVPAGVLSISRQLTSICDDMQHALTSLSQSHESDCYITLVDTSAGKDQPPLPKIITSGDFEQVYLSKHRHRYPIASAFVRTVVASIAGEFEFGPGIAALAAFMDDLLRLLNPAWSHNLHEAAAKEDYNLAVAGTAAVRHIMCALVADQAENIISIVALRLLYRCSCTGTLDQSLPKEKFSLGLGHQQWIRVCVGLRRGQEEANSSRSRRRLVTRIC